MNLYLSLAQEETYNEMTITTLTLIAIKIFIDLVTALLEHKERQANKNDMTILGKKSWWDEIWFTLVLWA